MEVILLEMTILEELNMGNIEKALTYVTDDFEGTTFDGLCYSAKKNQSVISKQEVVVTKDTFDCIPIDDDTIELTYKAYSEYAKQVVFHRSTWKNINGTLKMSKHISKPITE